MRRWFLTSLVLFVLAFCLWWIWPGSSNETPSLSSGSSDSSLPVATVVKPKKANQVVSDGALLPDQEPENNPYEDEAIKAQVQQIADAYEENARFPITSQPIRNPEDVRDFEPFEEAEVNLPFPDEDDEGEAIRLAAATNKFQYFRGDVIEARVRILNASADDFQSVTGVLSGARGDLPNPISFDLSTSEANTFYGRFDTQLAAPELLSDEMLLKLSVTVGSRDLFTTVALRYSNPSAQIIGLGLSQPQGAELVIPVQLNVFEPGYYFLTAVLDDANSGQALLQLQNEARLESGNAILNLKAHITALRESGSQGPYVLRQINLVRGAESGEATDRPGSSIQPQYPLPGFDFSAYSNEEFIDLEAQERLEFLRQIGDADQALETQE